VYHCPHCVKVEDVIAMGVDVFMLNTADKFLLVDEFCLWGDMIRKGGVAYEASGTRVSCAWGKLNELAPIFDNGRASLKVKGKIYKACVNQSVLGV